MEYKIDPSAYSAMFPVPAKIIDENLRLASSCQLKTILFFFRRAALGETVTVEDVARATGHKAEDIEDAFLFWEERGLLFSSDAPSLPAASKENDAPAEEGAVKVKHPEPEPLPIVKPSFEQVAERLGESEELQLLFREAQSILGRTIGYSGQSNLLMMHDNYGMPVEVILMLIKFASDNGQKGIDQIVKIARQWCAMEINDVKLADEYIKRQSRVDRIWKDFRNLSSVPNEIPTSKQRQYFNRWSDEYRFKADMIYLAYERSIEMTGKFSLPYTDKVLKGWHGLALKTPEDVEKAEELRRGIPDEKKDKKSRNAKERSETKQDPSKPSYDKSKYLGVGLNISKKR